MTSPLPPDRDLLDRYLSNECSSSERSHIAAWAASPENAERLAALRHTVSHPFGAPRFATSAEMRRKVWSAIDATRDADVQEDTRRPLPLNRDARQGALAGVPTRRSRSPVANAALRRWMWGAGTIGLAVLAVMVMRFDVRRPSGTTKTYATTTGQRATVLLSDGTRMMLAPETHVRLVNFSQNLRTIILDGEAYFEVRHAAGAPFIVRTGNVQTRVLGTVFTVRHYATDPHVRVAVTTGRVAVAGQAPQRPVLRLEAGWMADVTDSTVTTAAISDQTQYTSWIGDHLVFHRVPAAEVLAALTRWYGYKFRLVDSTVAHQELTVGLSTTSSAEALSTLEALLDADMVFDGDVIIVTRRTAKGRTMKQSSRDLRRELSTPQREVGR